MLIKREALVSYSCSQMYNLVNDVLSYPIFLPACINAEIISQNTENVDAKLTLRKGSTDFSLFTRNALVKDREINMQLIEGPFEYLKGAWEFSPIGGMGCHIQLHINFKINNSMLKILTSSVFKKICDDLIDHFVSRAHDIYAKK